MTKELKTPRKFKPSSQLWLRRQLNDPYVAKARKEGYRSRAAYKLLEIEEGIKCLKKNSVVVDLGSAPGSWAQVAIEKIGAKGIVIGIDLLPIDTMIGAEFIEGDFTEEKPLEQLEAMLQGRRVDVVLSDMAPNTTGHGQTDHLRIMHLCALAFDFAKGHLKEGGSFICKVFAGGTEAQLLSEIKKSFTSVRHVKPGASRKESAEIYLVAKGFRK